MACVDYDMFEKILEIVKNSSKESFEQTCRKIETCINFGKNFIAALRQIAIIPEAISHDSSEEKLFSKASDMLLARAFRELGLKSIVLRERGDSDDVIAESKYFNYTLVADAKAFRLSRTAKNQKDFKVSALSSWKQENNFAVLCAPYFQYPVMTSQIYSQALANNVCLFSWEHLIFLIEHNIKEKSNINLSEIWNFSETLSKHVLVSDMKKNFLPAFNEFIAEFLRIDSKIFDESLKSQILAIIKRAEIEKTFWLDEIQRIKNYSRKQAINELIKSRKIQEKLSHIETFIESIRQ